ncbi:MULTISPECIES: DUF7882 family protein [unclassified Agromyces]|uniref:DUF7882 family protein n=1 Tax=unclassified Agromyces TaxID=2639701 RepID=UPI003014DE5A
MRQHENTTRPSTGSALEVDGWMRIELDDDLLAHVALVVFAKLRRREPLLVSWTDPAGSRAQAWLHPNSTIVARHTAGVDTSIDRRRAERMMVAANSNWGLRLTGDEIDSIAAPRSPERVMATAS